MSKKKKVIILSVMMLLLIVTGVLNIVLNDNIASQQTSTVTTGNFFTTYRTDRQSTRDQELLYYEAIINSETSSADAINLAENKKLNLINSMETELVTEGLIKAQGFEDCIVTTSTSNVNVILKSGELSTSEVAKIVSIVKEQTGAKLDNIKIIPVE